MVVEESHDSSPLKPPDSPPTMLDIYQHANHPLVLDV